MRPCPAGATGRGLGAGSAASRGGVRSLPSCRRPPRIRRPSPSQAAVMAHARRQRRYIARGSHEVPQDGYLLALLRPRRTCSRVSLVSMAAGVLCRAAPASRTQQLRPFQLAWLLDVSKAMATAARICVPPILACRRCCSPPPHPLVVYFTVCPTLYTSKPSLFARSNARGSRGRATLRRQVQPANPPSDMAAPISVGFLILVSRFGGYGIA